MYILCIDGEPIVKADKIADLLFQRKAMPRRFHKRITIVTACVTYLDMTGEYQ